MRKILLFLCIAIWILSMGSALTADDRTGAHRDSMQDGKSVSDFLTPDGRFDLEAMRANMYSANWQN